MSTPSFPGYRLSEHKVELAKANNVDMAEAHGLAARDKVAQRAYAVSLQLAAEQEHAIEAGGRITAYVG